MTKHTLITSCIVAAAAALAALGIWLFQTPSPASNEPPARLEQPSQASEPTATDGRQNGPETPETQGTQATVPEAPAPEDPVLSTAQIAELDTAARDFVISYHRRSFEDPSASSWLTNALTNCTPEFGAELTTRFSGDGGLQWTRYVEGRSTTEARILRTQPGRTEEYPTGKMTMIVDYTVTTQSQDPMVAAADTPYVRTVELVRVGDSWKAASLSNLSGEPTA
ncbi:hypothetical protein [Paenarthrobacter nitroguajacolicus]|uniref:hypothetical protein n=1 Tax=Paenarthrobacter nitroguajacolicus TaxID=211146 RepID=UPI0015BF4CDA|nr:hypothetical protein [Paenarthrobacter nitroguajacolicus]NWL32057.1 hypothetical protein [Paenarthrobacter nitroguajacolicus]